MCFIPTSVIKGPTGKYYTVHLANDVTELRPSTVSKHVLKSTIKVAKTLSRFSSRKEERKLWVPEVIHIYSNMK
jgi:hypothetical protein